jgi:hypothetical protein
MKAAVTFSNFTYSCAVYIHLSSCGCASDQTSKLPKQNKNRLKTADADKLRERVLMLLTFSMHTSIALITISIVSWVAAPGHAHTCGFVFVHAHDQRQAALFLTNNFWVSFHCLSDQLVTLIADYADVWYRSRCLLVMYSMPPVGWIYALPMSWETETKTELKTSSTGTRPHGLLDVLAGQEQTLL